MQRDDAFFLHRKSPVAPAMYKKQGRGHYGGRGAPRVFCGRSLNFIKKHSQQAQGQTHRRSQRPHLSACPRTGPGQWEEDRDGGAFLQGDWEGGRGHLHPLHPPGGERLC